MVFRKCLQLLYRLELIYNFFRLLALHEHQHVDGEIRNLVHHLYIVLTEHDGAWDGVFGIGHHIAERTMALIVLAGLYLDGQHLAMLLDNEVKFALLLAVEIEQVVILRKSVGIEFLSHRKMRKITLFQCEFSLKLTFFQYYSALKHTLFQYP